MHLNQCAFHFSRLTGQGRSPERARRNLSAQLIAAWELFDLAPNDEFPPEADEPDWLVRVMEAAAAKRDVEHAASGPNNGSAPPLIVVVDGLDEAEPAAPGRDTRIPFGLPRPDELPDGVFIIATCKLGTPHEWAGSDPDRHIDLDQQSQENLADLRLYLERLASGPAADAAIVTLLKDARVAANVFVNTLERKSAGSWVYVRYILDELRSTQSGPDIKRLASLPDGLDTYYREQIRAWSATPDWPSLRLPALALLAALQGPVSAAELATYIKAHDADAIARWLGEQLRPFLDAEDDGYVTKYQILHQGLRDLIARDSNANPLSPGTDYLRRQIRTAYRAAHVAIADALLPGPLDDLSAWRALPQRARESLPWHAALGGILGSCSGTRPFT